MCDSCVDCVPFKMQIRLLAARNETLLADFKTHQDTSHQHKRKAEVIISPPRSRKRVRSRLLTRLHQSMDSDDAIDPAGDIMPLNNPTLVRTKSNRMIPSGDDSDDDEATDMHTLRQRDNAICTNMFAKMSDAIDDDFIDLPERKVVDTSKLTDMILTERMCPGRWCGTCGHDQHSGGQCHCIGDDDDGPDRWCTTCGFIDCICSLYKL
jgi:hypothetical protein